MLGNDEDLSVLLVKELRVVAVETLRGGCRLAFPTEHAMMTDAAIDVGRSSPAPLAGRTVPTPVVALAKHLELLLLRGMSVRRRDHSHHVSAPLGTYRMLLHVRVHQWMTAMVHLLGVL